MGWKKCNIEHHDTAQIRFLTSQYITVLHSYTSLSEGDHDVEWGRICPHVL